MKKFKAGILPATVCIAATACPLIINWYYSEHSPHADQSVTLSREEKSGMFDKGLLSHRLIRFDEDNGIAKFGSATKALGNVDYYLSDVRNNCRNSLRIVSYLGCANRLLGKHFYYSTVSSASSGWAGHYSDSYLNVYLLMDAMKLAGKRADIMYSPGHAFIAYRREVTGLWHYWETSLNHNSGGKADLGNDFYVKNVALPYYTPEDMMFAERLYPALVADKITDKTSRNALILKLYQNFPDNSLVQDAWYGNKIGLTEEDARDLVSLLKTDLSSAYKRVLLAKYFSQSGKHEDALNFISQIDYAHCKEACIALKSKYFFKYRFALWIKKQLGNAGMDVSFTTLFKSGRETLLLLAIIALCFIMYKSGIKLTIQPDIRHNHQPKSSQKKNRV